MTDSMNFGPDWIRNLSSEGNTAGGIVSGTRYQLADYRYGREEMLALFDKTLKPPASLPSFKALYSDQSLLPLALLPSQEEERGWQSRPTTLTGPPRGRGGSMDRGSRGGRGRGYQTYNRMQNYEMGWGNGEQPDWSPRKDFNPRSGGMDNWRRNRTSNEDEDGWRNITSSRPHEKWVRSTSWRGEGDSEERSGPPERGGRGNWQELNRGPPSRKSWDNEEHLPEWATENPTEGGGTFDSSGAFHGSDDEHQQQQFAVREKPLQKSTSQQHITSSRSTHHPPLMSSKSAVSLTKPEENEPVSEECKKEKGELKENGVVEKEQPILNIPQKIDKEPEEKLQNSNGKIPVNNNIIISNGPHVQDTSAINKSDEDFHRLQEDLVLKLVVDEEPPKTTSSTNFEGSVVVPPTVQPPPNLAMPQEKWFYQDPQGQMQGPFFNLEMAEWYKAGYFSNQLKVRRQCDERFVLLGELIALCGGADPFQPHLIFPAFKSDPSPTKLQEQDLLQLQFIQQFAMKHAQQSSRPTLPEPWQQQQQELAAHQRLQMLHQQQQQQQISSQDLPFMQQASAQTNPLMMMINKIQQANKLPPVQVDKPGVPPGSNPMDPLMMQMSNLHSMQSRLASGGGGFPPQNLPGGLPTDGGAVGGGGLPISALQGGLPGTIDIVPRPPSHTNNVEPPNSDNNPINSLLKQLKQQQQQQSQQMDSLWQPNQYSVPPSMHWQQQQQQQPTQQEQLSHSMWDMPAPPVQQHQPPSEAPIIQTPAIKKQEEKDHLKAKEELSAKELKKKKELEEKLAKKELEEKRKQEQRRQEIEKRVSEEKKKKEEERMRKELEKLKKEAEDKRLRELEEKRRLKEQRKAEEELRKKSEDVKRLEDEKARRELKEREEFAKKQAESVRALEQQHASRASKVAPWCQANTTHGMTLQEIQKAEKEKRAQEAVLQQQRQQQLQEQYLQQSQEKPSGIPMSWASKPMENRKVKSLAEIQAEEQDRLAKEAIQARLVAQQKEKETPVTNPSNIWNNQNLTWASASSNSSSLGGGFWEDVSQKSKPSISKSSSTSTIGKIQQQQIQQQQKQSKPKSKKEEQQIAKSNNNGHDEFTTWCHKTLSNMSTDVDIPTFITFLRDIESAFDVREYSKEYLGDSPATQQFASNFLEKRRSFKPKSNAHKDDMCSPAPAITPSVQHSTEFQEVKGKNKKNKKNKMFKVDSRILGFNVTSAPDRINVGDRDYGDNYN